MRSTVDLPDELFRALKVQAAKRGETLKDTLTRAVSREVAAGRREHRRVELPLIAPDVQPTAAVTADDIATALAEGDRRYAR